MKIISLQSENVKKLRAISITPTGAMVGIGGRNGQGKSSCLDSIEYALAGADSFPKVPVRRGEEKAAVTIDLGEVIVKRTFTSTGGTSLTITNKDGLKYSSPQSFLDSLVGKLSFDPLEFSRQDPDDQSKTLRELAGLDFTQQDQQRAALYDERTVSNRLLKSLEAQLNALPKPVAGIPDSELSASEIMQQQQVAAARNAQNEKKRATARDAKSDVVDSERDIAAAHENIASTKAEIEKLTERFRRETAMLKGHSELRDERNNKWQNLQKEADALTDEDLTQFQKKLQEVESTNALVRNRKRYDELNAQVKSKSKESDGLSAKIDAIDKAKTDAIAAAKFPLEGLTVDPTGQVMLDGLPFSQASSADQLRVSVSIGLALNPKLRVLLIRDGSLLDEDSLRLLAEIAAKNDGQVWLEKVGDDGHCEVIIEDGMVKEEVQEVTP